VSMNSALLGKVRALLAKAEGASTEEERDAYSAKASELVAKYGIDSALLAGEPQTDQVTDKRIVVKAPYAADKANLLYQVATTMRCRAILLSETRRHDRTVHLFGFASDLERAEVIYTSLLLQAVQGALDVRSDHGSVAVYRRSWFAGFTSSVVARLRIIEAQAAYDAESAQPGTSVALVLRSRDEAVFAAYATAYPDRRTTQRSRSGTGRSVGYAAGRTADIGARRINPSRPAIESGR